jgi:hypothetical protein
MHVYRYAKSRFDGKITESVINVEMVQFLVDKGHISKLHHAFIENLFTVSELLDFKSRPCKIGYCMVEGLVYTQTDII